MAEGGGLLNRYTFEKMYRGFESLRLRQFSKVRSGDIGNRTYLKLVRKPHSAMERSADSLAACGAVDPQGQCGAVS